MNTNERQKTNLINSRVIYHEISVSTTSLENMSEYLMLRIFIIFNVYSIKTKFKSVKLHFNAKTSFSKGTIRFRYPTSASSLYCIFSYEEILLFRKA